MTASPLPRATEPERFIARLQDCLLDDSFVSLVLSRPQDSEPGLDKLLVRPLVLRGEEHLSLLWRYRTRDITKNLPIAVALQSIRDLLGAPFLHAHLLTRSHDIQLALSRKGRWGLRIGKLSAPVGAPVLPVQQASHDRTRHRALSLDTPFLAELGVTDSQHRLVPAMARKWRQINKFVEILEHAIAQSRLALRDPKLPVTVLDFGAGKGYLTFAVHHVLQSADRVPAVTGVELRAELSALCNAAVARLGLQGLGFAAGDIGQFALEGSVDIMIALHACDIATDIAMHHGIRAGAEIILCSPCCHKQLRPQMNAPAVLAPMLRHGIHMTEQAEMLTDSLRALLLQAQGYDTQVFEFISPEHTGKNKMVLAVRRAAPLTQAQRAAVLAQVAELKALYGVREQHLETLIQAEEAGQRTADAQPVSMSDQGASASKAMSIRASSPT